LKNNLKKHLTNSQPYDIIKIQRGSGEKSLTRVQEYEVPLSLRKLKEREEEYDDL